MAATATETNAQKLSKEKRTVALMSVAAATAMTILKIVAGILSGSLGMLSDAAHSGLDLLGAGLTFFSVGISDRPADEDHTYGHAKIENISAFTETFLMAASCVWIVKEAVERIFLHPKDIKPSIWPFAVLLLSMAVDYWRSHQLIAVARRTGSSALEADALHFASDIWSSVAVFAGLGASIIGVRWNIPLLRFADPIAAITISIMILHFSWKLARKTIAVLMDAIPADTRLRMLSEVQRTDGVLGVERARVRRSGNSYFADLTLALPRSLTFQRTEQLVEEATAAVNRVLPNADVVIHTVPREGFAESIFDRVRAVASRNNVSIHDVSVQSFHGELRVEQHVEVAERMSLKDAHDFVCRLESEIRRDIPELQNVLTHIESEPATIEEPVKMDRDDEILESNLREAASDFPEIVDIHEVVVRRTVDRIQVSCHCTMPDDMSMERVHEVITSLEAHFRAKCPEVYRVLIHPEPVTDNTH
jgi:cation diffusion facilitator family transporter